LGPKIFFGIFQLGYPTGLFQKKFFHRKYANDMSTDPVFDGDEEFVDERT
jgi:hypothetical protein